MLDTKLAIQLLMMFKVDQLSLITGIDIFISEHQVEIHQPSINEIAILGEEKFFLGLNVFMINTESFKEMLLDNLENDQDISAIKNLTEFDIFLFLINTDIKGSNISSQVLNLILKSHTFEFDDNKFIGALKNKQNDDIIIFDSNLYSIIKDIVKQIFVLDKIFDTTSSYNPSNSKASEIAKKLAKSKEKIRAQTASNEQKSVFANMISILGIIGYTLQNLNSLTIYQLYNQFERYALRIGYDQSIQAAMAGAKVEIVDWFKQI